jgi:hydrogenase nickel incorporation protein HypA/HybF
MPLRGYPHPLKGIPFSARHCLRPSVLPGFTGKHPMIPLPALWLPEYCGSAPGNGVLLEMHEMSIAMNLIELASAAAQAEGAGRIRTIELEIGVLAGVMPEALEFCFEAAARDTLAEGATLTIVSIPAAGRCLDCGQESPMSSLASQCAHCGAWLLNITTGNELKIKAITIDDTR